MKATSVRLSAGLKQALLAVLMVVLALSQLAASSPATAASAPLVKTAPDHAPAALAGAVTVKLPLVDVQLYKNQPDLNGGETPYLGDAACTDTGCNADPQGRTLFRPVLTSLPPNVTVTNAVLHLYVVGIRDWAGFTRPMSFYRVTALWHAGLATWNHQPATAEQVGVIYAGTVLGADQTLNITGVVSSWYRGDYPNDGLLMKGPETTDNGFYRAFASSDYGLDDSGKDLSPYVEVTYLPTPATLSVPAEPVSWLAYGAGDALPQTVTLRNTGSYPFDWAAALAPGAPWLGLSQTAGTLGPQMSYQITLSPALAGLGYGRQSTSLQISTTDVAGAPGLIPVTLTYSAPMLPVSYIPAVMTLNNPPGPAKTPVPTAPPPPAKAELIVVAVGIDIYRYAEDDAAAAYRAGIFGKNLHNPENDITTTTASFALLRKRGSEHCQNSGPLTGSAFTLNAGCTTDAPVKIFSLQGAQAVKASIQQTLEYAATLAGPQTTLVFTYSGHGGALPDRNGDEADGADEFIATFLTDIVKDAQGNPIDYKNVITDDELGAWLDAIPAGKTVVMLDSCYSGGMLSLTSAAGSPAGWRSRGLPPLGLAADPANLDSAFIQDLARPNRVVLAASGNRENAIEVDALRQGIFSYYLTMALTDPTADANHNGWVSAVEAFNYLKPKVVAYAAGLGSVQTPQLSWDLANDVELTQP